MAKVNDPRYPHKCVIYRGEAASSFSPDGDVTILYEGECRKSGSTNIRTFNTGSNNLGKVDTADYRVSIPGIVAGIRKGDLISATDLLGTEDGMRIVYVAASAMANGTEVFCNIASN